MSRLGQNPMKWIKNIHRPEKITVTTIVHIPFLGEYWQQSLEVLKLCLQSMGENTRMPFDLMVFDNGSCKETQDYLLEMKGNGKIQYLILSEHNLGKAGAWNFLFQAAPGEIVSYADSDVYFLPGWLEESIKVLEAFPEAGMVTAQPIMGGIPKSGVPICETVKNDPTLSFRRGNLIPEKYIKAHVIGLGISMEEFLRQKENREDLLITRGGVSAYIVQSHFQFTARKEVIQIPLPLEASTPFGDKVIVDNVNFWWLATAEYLVHHMGNEIPSLKDELEWVKDEVLVSKTVSEPKPSVTNKFLRNNSVRSVLKYLNVLTYRLLYKK